MYMATAKKLPSGSWRCQVFSHYEPLFSTDGSPVMDPKTGKQKQKRIYESFTSNDPTARGKKEAELLAAQFSLSKNRNPNTSLTVREAVKQYIDLKQAVLSPTTYKEYRCVERLYFSKIGDVLLKDLTNPMIQAWVSSLSTQKAPKTVKNIYGLLTAVLDMFMPEFRVRINLPKPKKAQLHVPSDTEIKELLNCLENEDLKLAVLLAAFGTLRRGEICALTSDDIHGNTVSVNKSMAKTIDGTWVIKQPKTYSSYRNVEYPDFIIDMVNKKKGRIVNLNPDQITNRFCKAIRKTDLPHFRFHDLRHYAASIMHALGIPDVYIMQRGGWSSDATLKSIYRNVIDEEAVRFNQSLIQHINSMQHEMQHEKKKAL